MKTLHLTNAYHGTSGGIRTFYHALLKGANREHRHLVLIVPGREDGEQQVGAFGRIYTVRAIPAPAFDRRYRLILPWQYFPVIGRRLVGILEREQPDIVEICDKYSLLYLAGMLRKHWHRRVARPTILGLSCERFDDNMSAYLSPSNAALAFTRWYIRALYGPPFDYHVANSRYTAEELRTILYDRAPDFIHVCPPGVDAAAFGPERRSGVMREQLIRRAGGREDSTLLLYAGRLSPEKNLQLLVDTMRLLAGDPARDYRLVLAGDGPRAAWLQEQASGALEGRFVFSGSLDRDTLAACYATCDVFVHPNPREPFGIGPLEAMASGVPVVAPASGGVMEYANAGNAFLAAPDAAAFAAAVRQAAAGDAERTRAALATAREFHWPRVTRRYFELYDELHERRTRAQDRRVPDSSPDGWSAAGGAPGARDRGTPHAVDRRSVPVE